MKMRHWILGLWITFLIATSCNYSNAQHKDNAAQVSCLDDAFDQKVRTLINFSVPTIDVDSLRTIQKEVYIFDAREREEFEVSHIPGAMYIGYNEFNTDIVAHIPKSAKIVVYCSIGYRSERISNTLVQAGYQNVHNLFGSIFEWTNRGYPLVRENGSKTDSLHTFNRKWSRWVDNTRIKKVW